MSYILTKYMFLKEIISYLSNQQDLLLLLDFNLLVIKYK
jgi:hypothetical protein